jgi:formylglycine-generating enzyme required for sulfatase activity
MPPQDRRADEHKPHNIDIEWRRRVIPRRPRRPARAGSTAATYGELDKVARYGKNSGNSTHDVRGKLPNAWGLYDMLGNAWEWAADWHAADW